jgi:hypothetical protein
MKRYTIKLNIYLILLLVVILSFIVFYLNGYYKELQLITIYKDTCHKDIFDYMAQKDSIIYFNHYTLSINNQIIHLPSSFFDTYLLNENIEEHLTNLNWREVITLNGNNMEKVVDHVRQSYLINLQQQERNFTIKLYQNPHFDEIKDIINNTIQNHINTLDLGPLQKTIAKSNMFITDFIKSIDLSLYIRTAECQNKEFTVLLQLFAEKAESINIPKDISLLSTQELLSCDICQRYLQFLIIFGSFYTVGTFKVLASLIVKLFFMEYVNTKSLLIVGSVLFNNIDDLNFDTDQDFHDCCLKLAELLIEKEGVLGIIIRF